MADISNHNPFHEQDKRFSSQQTSHNNILNVEHQHSPYTFTINPFSLLESESESESESDCLYGHDEEYDQLDYITDLFHSPIDTEPISNNNNNNNNNNNTIEELGLGLRVASIESDSDTEPLTEVTDQNWYFPSFDTDGSSSVIDRIDSIESIDSISVSSDREVLEWEILLAVNNLERELEFVTDGGEGFLFTAEFDTLITQFVETVRGLRGSRPAAKSVVDSLPFVALKTGDEMCAVCKDGVLIGEKVVQLPCGHYYHGECIVPWLGMRNTCPVCRFELPTEDVDYERSKDRENEDELQVRYGLELLS